MCCRFLVCISNLKRCCAPAQNRRLGGNGYISAKPATFENPESVCSFVLINCKCKNLAPSLNRGANRNLMRGGRPCLRTPVGSAMLPLQAHETGSIQINLIKNCFLLASGQKLEVAFHNQPDQAHQACAIDSSCLLLAIGSNRDQWRQNWDQMVKIFQKLPISGLPWCLHLCSFKLSCWVHQPKQSLERQRSSVNSSLSRKAAESSASAYHQQKVVPRLGGLPA